MNDSSTNLEVIDYAILHFIYRDDPTASLHFGTLRTVEGLLKLHNRGLIKKSYRDMTFDELEQFTALIKSDWFKNYDGRLHSILTRQVKDRIELVCKLLEIKSSTDLMGLTDEGKMELYKARSEMFNLYDDVTTEYEESKTSVDWDKYVKYYPMLSVMGFQGEVMNILKHASKYNFFTEGKDWK